MSLETQRLEREVESLHRRVHVLQQAMLFLLGKYWALSGSSDLDTASDLERRILQSEIEATRGR